VVKRSLIAVIVVVCVIVSGCRPEKVPGSMLVPIANSGAVWNLEEGIRQTGEGNVVRVVSGKALPVSSALELAAGGQGQIKYVQETEVGAEVIAHSQVQFLSTQGTGRVELSALDEAGRILGSVGWVVTGPGGVNTQTEKWTDIHYPNNYTGKWLEFGGLASELLERQFPGIGEAAKKYRLSVEVGQGQHVLVAENNFEVNPILGLTVTTETKEVRAAVGDTLAITVTAENKGRQPITGATLQLMEPYAYGIVARANTARTMDLAPGEKKQFLWQVIAERPDSVNLGNPWRVQFSVNGTPLPAVVDVHVVDNRPGEIFYCMTEDLEPIDGAGYPTSWGNGDGWLEPAELRVQMVEKVEKADAIANQYGAKWTHYIAWPVVKAAAWADKNSSKGQWQSTIKAIENSVRREASYGHEYGVHMHSDYDPDLPDNILSYNSELDGFWANHLRHGWAHTLENEGKSFDEYASRTGTLYNYLRILQELTDGSPLGQLLTTRAGSFDFGDTPASQLKSTMAYGKVGLLGGSDADGNLGGITSSEYGQEIYLADPANINAAATDIRNVGIVEVRPTPRQFLEYDNQDAGTMNQKVDQGMMAFALNGKILPGVHAIVGFTHMMFIMGEGGWSSTEGGQFRAIDEHLRYVRDTYVADGRLKFATASELVRAYLDYYSPQPVAVYGPKASDNWGTAEYPITILGRDIPIDSAHPHSLQVKYPLYLRDSAYRISILKNGQPIYTTSGLPTPFNDISFVVDDSKAKYTMHIHHNKYIFRALVWLRSWKEAIMRH